MRWSTLLLASVISLLAEPALAQNLIDNGSFEDGDYSGGAWETISPGDTDITSWTVGGAGVDWHNTIEMRFPNDGDLAVDLNLSGGGLSDTGTVAQSFTTVSGQEYLLSFFLAGPAGGSFPDPRQVRVDVAGVTQTFSTPASPHDALVWERMDLEFTAVDSQTTLTFASVDGTGYWGPLLDSVSVDEVNAPTAAVSTAVPVSGIAGLALLAAALVLFGLVALRKP